MQIVKYSILFAALLCLASCEKVVQLDLNNSVPSVVIQGNIYDQPGPYYIRISKSVNFDESSTYPPVTGARVEITDNFSQTEVLSEPIPGTYVTSKLRGFQGRTYSLSVKTDNVTFKSSSTMPFAVRIDSISFNVSPFSGEKVTTIRFNDPPVTINYYRIVYYINSVLQKEFYTLDDDLFQGAMVRFGLQSRGSEIKLAKGDKVTIWLESIDKGVYEYFRTTGMESGQSTSPANPVSNISNGALGYFNACSVRKISATVDK